MDFHAHLIPHQISTGMPVTFDINVIWKEEDGELRHDECWLEASITDQARIKLRHSEGIEPEDFRKIIATLMTGIEDARTFADADWSLKGPKPDLKAFMSVAVRSGVTQKADDMPEEGEEKALRVDFRIELDGEEIQTGMVDWQGGLYIWDGAEIDFHVLPWIAEVVFKITERCKEIMVEVRCWN